MSKYDLPNFEDFLTKLVVRFREELEPSLEEIQRREKIREGAEIEYTYIRSEIEKHGRVDTMMVTTVQFIHLSDVWFEKLKQTHPHLLFETSPSEVQGTLILRWSPKPTSVDLVMKLFQLPPSSRSVLEKMELDYEKVDALIKSVRGAGLTVKEMKEIVINQSPSKYKIKAQTLLFQTEEKSQAWKDSISFLVDMIAKSVES